VVKAKESSITGHVFDPGRHILDRMFSKSHLKRNILRGTTFNGTHEKNINETDYNKYVDRIFMLDPINYLSSESAVFLFTSLLEIYYNGYYNCVSYFN
jgi:hypothetical protein